MKKYLMMLFVAILPVIAFTSCSDDDDVSINEANIIGKWLMISEVGWEKENGKIEDRWNYEYGEDEPYYYIFNNDGTGYEIDATGPQTYTYYWDWHLEGNRLYITNSDYDLTIKSLTESTVVVACYYKDVDDGVVWEEYMEMTFARVN